MLQTKCNERNTQYDTDSTDLAKAWLYSGAIPLCLHMVKGGGGGVGWDGVRSLWTLLLYLSLRYDTLFAKTTLQLQNAEMHLVYKVFKTGQKNG